MTLMMRGLSIFNTFGPLTGLVICAAAYFSFGKAPGKYCEPRKAGAKMPGRLART